MKALTMLMEERVGRWLRHGSNLISQDYGSIYREREARPMCRLGTLRCNMISLCTKLKTDFG